MIISSNTSKTKIKARYIGDYSKILGDVTIGEETWVGSWVEIQGQNAPIKIGKWCDISDMVMILDHSTHLRCVEIGDKIIAPITIGDHVFIGSSAKIIPNNNKSIKIGHHSIIGAFSLVQKSIPPYSIAVGIPAKIIKKVKQK
jgi:acetyltransferase-like isoleucine patch superfamily enzyme